MTTTEPARHVLAAAVARRLRGQLAERRISQKRFGELTGWGRGHIYQRMSGNVPLDLDELEHIEQTTGIPLSLLLPRMDSNHQPPGCVGKPFWPAQRLKSAA